eukprot:819984_1
MYSPIINLIIAASLFVHAISTQSTFRNLSSTAVFKDAVVPYLDLAEVLRSPHLTYHAFKSEFPDIRAMESIINRFIETNRTSPTDLNQLAALHAKLQFSPLFSYRLVKMMSKLGKHFRSLDTLRTGNAVNPDLIAIHHALNITCITMDQYKQLSFPDYSNETALKAKILILSSFSNKIFTAKLNASEMVRRERITKAFGSAWLIHQRFVHFPWLTAAWPAGFGHVYYFTLIYEYCWNAFASDLNIPKFHAIFHPESYATQKAQIKNLKNLMSNYGLRLWHPQAVLEVRNGWLNSFLRETKMNRALVFWQMIPRMDMVNDVLFHGCNDHPLRHELMVVLVLNLWPQLRNHSNFTDHAPFKDRERITSAISQIELIDLTLMKDVLIYHLWDKDRSDDRSTFCGILTEAMTAVRNWMLMINPMNTTHI